MKDDFVSSALVSRDDVNYSDGNSCTVDSCVIKQGCENKC